MQFDYNIELVGSVYHVQVGLDGSPEQLTQEERKAIVRFGEPLIDLGGSFTGSPSFTLETRVARFPSQFPVKQLFDSSDDEDAAAKAVIFKNTIKARILAGMQTKRTLVAGAVGHGVDPVDTTP